MKTTSLFKTLMLGTALFGTAAFAQSEHVGGGGDIVTCKENGASKSYLLDVYEGLGKMPINLGGPNLTIEQKVELMASIYGSLDQYRAAKYLKSAREMLEDITAIEQNKPAPHHLVSWTENGQKLKDIDDADELYEFPSNCKKQQLVRQDSSYGAIALYTIDRNLFNKLDNDQKVATIYHEVIYKDYRDSGAVVSKDARYLNRMIFSQKIDTFTHKSYLNFLDRTHLKGRYLVAGKYEARDGVQPEFDSNGNIVKLHFINFPFFLKLKETTFALNTMTLKDEVFTDATLSSHYFYEETAEGDLKQDTLKAYISGNFLIGNSITVQEDEKYLVELTKLNRDTGQIIPGTVTVLIDKNAHILSRSETGFPNKPVDPKMSEALSELFSCLKPLAKKEKNKETVLSFLEKSREGIAKQDPAIIDALTNECVSNGDTSLITASLESIELYKKLSIKKMNTQTVMACKGFNLSASAGLLMGAKAGVTVNLVCTFQDGTRRVYTGFNVGLGIIDFGATVSAGTITYSNHTGIRIGAGGALIQELSSESTPGYWNRGKHEDMLGRTDSMQSKQHSIGLSLNSVNIGFHALVRTGKRSDNYDLLVKEIVSKIVVPITPN